MGSSPDKCYTIILCTSELCQPGKPPSLPSAATDTSCLAPRLPLNCPGGVESAHAGGPSRMFRPENAQSLVGVALTLAVCWAMSEDRSRFPWKLALGAIFSPRLRAGLVRAWRPRWSVS